MKVIINPLKSGVFRVPKSPVSYGPAPYKRMARLSGLK